jgi:hypothetical protein
VSIGPVLENDEVNAPAYERARDARILTVISFHFVHSRVGFLAEVLRSLAEYPVSSMHVVIVTNTLDHDQLTLLRRLCAEILIDKPASIRSFGNLSNPWHLTWCHKSIIAKEFVDGNLDRYTHFIYLESDIRLGFINFCYFLDFRCRLRKFGLLPAFIRVEYGAHCYGFVTSDFFWPVYVPAQSHLQLGDTVFVNVPNPYNPFFILDLELAREYVRSRSFDLEASHGVAPWAVADRSAMGLCFENVPPGFQSRYVVPVLRQTGMVPACAWVGHLPNNYADNPSSPLGKVRMDELFMGVQDLAG